MDGDLSVLVRSFVRSMPGRDSRGYRPPSEAERRSMELAFRAVLRADLAGARTAADQVGYEVAPLTDRISGRELVLLAEPVDDDRPPRGWGLFVHAGGGSDATIEVPHPVHDAHTESLAVSAYRSTDWSNLFVAGAHRHANPFGAADVAHQPLSVFETLHRVAIERPGVVFQPHGFDSRGARRTWDAVVSSGGLPPDVLATTVARRLRRLGVRAVLFDGEACRVLGGTNNVQGWSTRARGGRFLHVELAHRVRSDAGLTAEVAAAVAGAVESFLADPVA
jgi:hypothetical protein